jgi:lysophospholipase L1-like esterase
MDEETLAMAKEYTDEKQKELLEALPEDTTATGMEVADIRTGFDGTVYKTAGEAVREQVKFSANELKNISADTANILSAVGNYVFDDSVEIQDGYYDCQPNGATFYENPNYKSVRVSCVDGEKYRISTFHWLESIWPAVWLYAQDNTLIKTVDGTAIDTNGGRQYEDCEFTIPANCAFFIVNCINSEYVKFTIEKFELKEAATLEYVNSQLITRETGFRELRLDIQNGYYDCQQNGEVFISHGNYKSAKVACVVGEKYQVSTYIYAAANFPVAWLYSTAGTLIGTVGGLTGAGSDYGEQIDDFEFTIPENCAYFITSTYVLDYARFRVKRYMPGVKPLYGKNAVYLGDSITYIDNGWRTEFNAVTGANEVLCTAVSGAHLCDYEDTVLDGVNFEGSKNTISNQVQRIINNPPAEAIDFIIIAAGTNDHASLAEFEGGVTQFVENDAYIDVDTVDRTRYDGAMRWIAEKLWDLFPEAVIFFATPIQGAEAIRETLVQMLKSDYIQEIAGYLGTPTIDATRKSGIYGRYENANANGKYLYDGLHPNPAGRTKLGRYYASEVINYFSYLKD